MARRKKRLSRVSLAHKSQTQTHCITLSQCTLWPRGLGTDGVCVGKTEVHNERQIFISTDRSLHIYSPLVLTLLCCLHTVTAPSLNARAVNQTATTLGATFGVTLMRCMLALRDNRLLARQEGDKKNSDLVVVVLVAV